MFRGWHRVTGNTHFVSRNPMYFRLHALEPFSRLFSLTKPRMRFVDQFSNITRALPELFTRHRRPSTAPHAGQRDGAQIRFHHEPSDSCRSQSKRQLSSRLSFSVLRISCFVGYLVLRVEKTAQILRVGDIEYDLKQNSITCWQFSSQ